MAEREGFELTVRFRPIAGELDVEYDTLRPVAVLVGRFCQPNILELFRAESKWTPGVNSAKNFLGLCYPQRYPETEIADHHHPGLISKVLKSLVRRRDPTASKKHLIVLRFVSYPENVTQLVTQLFVGNGERL